jgi:uncharacterized membrane protein SpoIIM required for sporulation
MKVVELLERRRRNWQELERMCEQLQGRDSDMIWFILLPGIWMIVQTIRTLNSGTEKLNVPPPNLSRFAALYRAACADLALAHAYQLPQDTTQYLHRLVGRAHNQLYRSRRWEVRKWAEMLLFDVPQRIFNDRCVQVMFVIFWGLFILSAWLAYSKTAWPEFAEQMLGEKQITTLEEMYKNPIDGSQRSGEMNMMMAGFYQRHNTGIGLQCFAWGLLVIPGLLYTIYNAIVLGASFGYMARPDVPAGENFMHFVTAHGPFELTAIVISAGAGLRLGMSWMMPGTLSRYANLQKTGREMMPVMGSAIVMFFMAALIEGFLSPSAAPYWVKAVVAIVSSALLAVYFIVLGFPRRLLI